MLVSMPSPMQTPASPPTPANAAPSTERASVLAAEATESTARFHVLVKGSPIDAADKDGDPTDDVWCGEGFDSEAEARELFEAWAAGDCDVEGDTYAGHFAILIDMQLALVEERRIPGRRKRDADGRFAREDESLDDAWRRERAMEAGMLHGCDAYNDEMGF